MAIEKRYFEHDIIYDIETYKNIFTVCMVHASGKYLKVFEISDRKNETEELMSALRKLRANKYRMVGFNNNGFDYPILHEIMEMAIKAKRKRQKFELSARVCYDLAQKQIDSFKDGFGHTIRASEQHIEQVDLFKINHFDNKAKSTSLKMLEFNMRSDTIEDLPYHHTSHLNSDQMDVLIEYNKHDVLKTLDFYYACYDGISFRMDLSKKYGTDFTNHNDTKIGKDYFIQRLEENKKGTCYSYFGDKRVINRTVRDEIDIGECLFKYYDFERKEFEAVRKWFASQLITETKGVFTDIPEHLLGDVAKYAEMITKKKKWKASTLEECQEQFNEIKKEYPLATVVSKELKAKKKGETQYSYWATWNIATTLNVVIDGFRFDFGVGGIHGSITSAVVEANADEEIEDADVSSMYPNIGIKNRVYPEHLGEDFCDIYEDVYNQRKTFAKGTAENAVMKLALNGVYGDSNNKFSPFFDTKYTMTITINGQLSICLLAERLMKIEGLTIIQVNTDGITCKFPRKYRSQYDAICKKWQAITKLELEFASYSKMFIRDVNNYFAIYTNNKVKRKGAYEFEKLDWHKDHSRLIVQKAVDAYFTKGTPIREFITKHEDVFDFMLRTKVPRSSRLVLKLEDDREIPLQNICRYYVSEKGGKLLKIMPPLEGKTEERILGIEKEWLVKPCNNMKDFTGDINFEYYIAEAEKLASLVPTEEDAE